MNASQEQALAKITELMREHFDAAIFVFETDAEEVSDPELLDLSYRYSGTFTNAIGLLEYGKHRLLRELSPGESNAV